MESITVSVAEAARLTGFTPGQISNMIFHGPIKPEHHIPYGTGDQAMLGERNVKELVLIFKMRKAGLKPDMIKSIIELLATSSIGWWKEEGNYVVVMNDKWFVTDNVFANIKRLNCEYALSAVDKKRFDGEYALLFRLD